LFLLSANIQHKLTGQLFHSTVSNVAVNEKSLHTCNVFGVNNVFA